MNEYLNVYDVIIFALLDTRSTKVKKAMSVNAQSQRRLGRLWLASSSLQLSHAFLTPDLELPLYIVLGRFALP
jgi:hypothetical protein